MTKIRHSFEGCGTRGGFSSTDDLVISSGSIILGPDGGTQTTFSGNSTVAVAASRELTNEDDGKTLECTAGSISLTVPVGLRVSFGCAVIPNGTTSIVSSGGALLNGATTTLTRAAASNAAFGLISRVSATDSYVVTGA